MGVVTVVLGVLTVLLLAVVLVLQITRGPQAGQARDLAPVRAEVRDEVRAASAALRQDLSAQRAELQGSLSQNQQVVGAQLSTAAAAQSDQLGQDRAARAQADVQLRELLQASIDAVTDRLDAAARLQTTRQQELRDSIDAQLTALRHDNERALEKIRQSVDEKLRETLQTALKENADRIQALDTASAQKHVELQSVLRAELEKMRTGNEAKLEKMRETVDEKLQGTLEKRLGESFELVSQRLEQVQKGLGEMQSLASDVGGLKRVLTNVKNRGSWGEVQLSRQLEDILTSSQYDENVAIRPGDTERVEFAVRLPGRDDDGTPVYLPIDSKFPQEDYERLLQAQEDGEKGAVEAATRALEQVVIGEAKRIAQKYIQPPHSTDFAIMYLPTEGLFAEVVRRPGLAARMQREQRVLVTGPTTLMSLLNSLQVGFRSVAIEKRSSEVWQVLSAAKAEFKKYGEVWDKLGKQLTTAQNTVAQAGRRTRAVERTLRVVEDAVEVDAAAQLGALAVDVAAMDAAGHVGSDSAGLDAAGLDAAGGVDSGSADLDVGEVDIDA